MFGFAKKLVTFANDKDFYSNIKKRMLMKKGLLHRFLMVTSVLFSCSFTHAADVIPTADIFQNSWLTTHTVLDIENPNGVCYLLDYNNPDGFAHDEDGNYITISVREYCEQFANDWNADPANEKITTEEAADRFVAGLNFVRFNVTQDNFLMTYGYDTFSVTLVDGSYKYDFEKGVITVDDNVENTQKDFTLTFDEESKELVFFNFTEWYPLSLMSYDKTKDYYVFAPTYYYCNVEGGETSIKANNVEKLEVGRYSATGVKLTAPQKGINIIKMNDGSTRKVLVR